MADMPLSSGQNFAACYAELCKQQHSRPLSVICVTLPHSLDFTTDRVKMDDWSPILSSLSLDRSLRSVSVRSRYQCRKPLEEINSEDKVRTIGKAPVVLTRFLLERLSQSVAQCVRNSPVLTSLELEGIPLPVDCLAVLCVGLSSTETLQHLSLQRCHIGDGGCELICRTIADVHSVRSLNLSQCDLSSKSGSPLAAALSRQKLSLYHDTWKQSLRYRKPDLNAMPGLRRLTLNGNPRLTNSAVVEVIEAIRDSLWLKALDLQHCGLTDSIGNELLDLLRSNSTLAIVDVRMNYLNDRLVQEILKKLENNNANGQSEYRWLGLPQKDNRRPVSAGSGKNQLYKGTVNRSRSAVNRQPKRPSQSLPARRIVPTSNVAKRIKTRQPPPCTPNLEEEDSVNAMTLEASEAPARVSLHLDLQAQIRSVVAEETKKIVRDDESEIGHPARASKDEVDDGKLELSPEQVAIFNVEQILRQLVQARAEHDRLLEETKRTELLLAEERARREAAETKLVSTRNYLTELEEALKEKERETRGFMLISQRSLDEICSSFDRLLEMLESVTRGPNDIRRASSREELVRADIKRQMALLIRKTKSENFRRSTDLLSRDLDSPTMEATKKFARSENDITSSLPPIVSIHLERNIGDSPDVVSPSQENFRENAKSINSSRERARAIFARIVNGESILNLDSRVG